MRKDAIKLEDGRLEGRDTKSYPWIYERHRIFPQIFEPGRYKQVLDIAAGDQKSSRYHVTLEFSEREALRLYELRVVW